VNNAQQSAHPRKKVAQSYESPGSSAMQKISYGGRAPTARIKHPSILGLQSSRRITQISTPCLSATSFATTIEGNADQSPGVHCLLATQLGVSW
jgi:hypothetical protein